MKKSILSISLLSGLLSASMANGALLASFDGNSFANAAAPVANLTVSDISADTIGGDGFNIFETNGGYYNMRSVTFDDTSTDTERLDAQFGNGAFSTFTLTAEIGFAINVDRITFQGWKGGSSSRVIGMATSADNNLGSAVNLNYLYAGDPGSTSPVTVLDINSVDNDLSAYQGLSSLTFVIPIDGSNTVRMDNIIVEGTVAVPEPSTYALFAGLLGFGWIIIRRRRS